MSADPALVAALEAHRFNKGLAVCLCGAEMAGKGNRSREHRAHLAAALDPLIAERERAKASQAWNEALHSLAWAMDNGTDAWNYVRQNNPYREDTP